MLYLDGLPIATHAGGETTFLMTLDPQAQWQAQTALLRRGEPEVPTGAAFD